MISDIYEEYMGLFIIFESKSNEVFTVLQERLKKKEKELK